MMELLAVFGFGSMVLFAVGLVAMIVQLLRRKSKIVPTIILVLAVVIFVVSVVVTP